MENKKLVNFNFGKDNIPSGLFILAGGFEDRVGAFIKKTNKTFFSPEKVLILHYLSQIKANEKNYAHIKKTLKQKFDLQHESVDVTLDKQVKSCLAIKSKIKDLSAQLSEKKAFVDISGMTHLFALICIHACRSLGLETYVIYTEANTYFPLESEKGELLHEWKNQYTDCTKKYLQSSHIKSIDIVSDFVGNFRTGKPSCLIIFVGFEPNRVDGLIDKYAPKRIVVIHGKSPHKELYWRTSLSKELHRDTLLKWYRREITCSTFHVGRILSMLEKEFEILQEEFDISISPHCSKLQALASYLFWLKHPETQLVFTTPGRFNPDRYSKGMGETFVYGTIE